MIRRIQGGSLGLLLSLEEISNFDLPLDEVKAGVVLTRPGHVIPPGIDPRDNPHVVGEGYYLLGEIKGRRRRNHVTLDRVLSSLDETVVIAITVARAEIAAEAGALRTYAARLGEVLHPSRLDAIAGVESPLLDATHLHDYVRPVEPPIKPDAVAEGPERSASDLLRVLGPPSLRFGAYVMAQSATTARLVAGALAEGTLDDGSYGLLTISDGDELQALCESLRHGRVHPFRTLARFYPGNVPACCAPLEALSQVASVSELTSLVAPPVAGPGPTLTVRKDSDPLDVAADRLFPIGQDWCPGGPVRDIALLWRGIVDSFIATHFGSLGMTGTGKTSLGFAEVIHWASKGVPVVILECSKREYRDLLRLRRHSNPALRNIGRGIRLCSPSTNKLPYRRNQLILPTGASVDEGITSVLTSLKASTPLEGPMQPLLVESLHTLYDHFENRACPPTYDDLLMAYISVVRSKHYEPSVEADLIAAGLVRFYPLLLGRSGDAYRTSKNVPSLDPLPSGCLIIELEGLSREQAQLEAISLLSELRQILSATPHRGDLPRIVVVIEEAHVVFPPTIGPAQASPDAPYTAAFAEELITRLLAEGRAAGLSISIFDQHPTAISPAVLKSVGSIVCFKQQDLQDVERMAEAMLLSPEQRDELIRFGKGDCFFSTDGYVFPRRLRLPNTKKDLGLEEPLSEQELLLILEEDPQYRRDMEESIFGTLEACNHRVDRLWEVLDSIPSDLAATGSRNARASALARWLRDLEEWQADLFRSRGSVKRLAKPSWLDGDFRSLIDTLEQRFDKAGQAIALHAKTLRAKFDEIA
ncbi:MAG: ATP-binding protein [Candidatus Hydrogenedentes bacterium]|nr:ATP-binding protein [Candidatus Hydrogenedentota bacterium]